MNEGILFLSWCADNGWYRNGKTDEWYQLRKQNENKTVEELYQYWFDNFYVKPIVEEEEKLALPKLVGHLKKPFGLNGYDKAEIGHPIFEHQDRYFIILLNGPKSLPENKVPFYKETLKPFINYV